MITGQEYLIISLIILSGPQPLPHFELWMACLISFILIIYSFISYMFSVFIKMTNSCEIYSSKSGLIIFSQSRSLKWSTKSDQLVGSSSCFSLTDLRKDQNCLESWTGISLNLRSRFSLSIFVSPLKWSSISWP